MTEKTTIFREFVNRTRDPDRRRRARQRHRAARKGTVESVQSAVARSIVRRRGRGVELETMAKPSGKKSSAARDGRGDKGDKKRGRGSSASAAAAPVTAENRLKRDTAFLCHMQFKNDLPAVPIDWKMLQTRVDRRALAEYSHLSLYDGLRKRGDFSDDLGIPLDPSLMRAYRVPAERAKMDPEDHDVLMDSAEREGKRARADGASGRASNRPDASDALWLMNTQYISAGNIKARTGLSEKEMKRRKLATESGNDSATEVELSQVEQIEASFEAAKKPPVHPTKKGVTAVEVLPVLPDFERMAMDYVRLNFDEKQQTDVSSLAGKPENVVENALECGVVKPFSIVNDRDQTERFLSLMLPKDSEAAMAEDYLTVDGEGREYEHVRDYVYKIHHDDPNMGGGNMCFFFKKDKVTYIDLHTKLTLSKKSKHSKGKDAVDWRPSKVTLKKRSLTAEENEALDAKRASLRN